MHSAYESAITTAKNSLKKCFSATQVEHLLAGTNVNFWKDDDISKALTLRSLSPKAYKLLREQWKFPLPSLATLYRWSNKVDVEPGIIQSVINLLKYKSESMTQIECVCVISFDEMSISKVWSYDKATDTLYEPKSKVQCVMIRGLLSSWKQLIYFEYDTDLTKNLLYELISQVESAGFSVVGMVCDMGPTNARLWNSLGINMDNTSFCNPFDNGRDVFVFADAPHIIKLFRNHFLDRMFKLSDGRYAHSGPVREIIQKSRSDLRPAHKLSGKHINVLGTQRMNVKLAVQLLSETTSKCLEYFGNRGLLEDKHWKDTSEFIDLVDKWFDVFNSRVPLDTKPSRNAYGLNLEGQNKILQNMIKLAREMEVIGGKGKGLYPFQKGLVISSVSLMNLLKMLQNKFGMSYILTYRLNQDGLEHFFGCIRQMGACHQHPHPVAFKHRVRAHLLGKEVTLLGSKCNVESCDGVNVTSSAFSDFHSKESTSIENDEHSLQKELSLSAMLFCLPEKELQTCNDEDQEIGEDLLEDAMEEGGLQYVGGFIARKFPQYDFLGTKVTKGDGTWIGAVSRGDGKLMKPKKDFLEKLETMERMFLCYHGEKSLKAGQKVIQSLAVMMYEHISLPKEVIKYFVRCRTFFRIRVLNRHIASSRKINNKMKKLIT